MVDSTKTRAGLLDVEFGYDLSGGASFTLPTTPEGAIRLASSAEVMGNLPPGVRALGNEALGAIGNVMDAVQGALPAINLIGDIASGHPPTDPQQIILPLAAAVATVNPLAGAFIGAAGELVSGLEDATADLFKTLGLIDNGGGHVAYDYIGMIRAKDPNGIPWGTDNPNWKTWDYWMTPVAQGWRWGALPLSGNSYYAQLPFYQLLSVLGRYHPPRVGPPENGPIGQNDFETFFFMLLKANLEKWMNANPTVSPRDLLKAAIALWNHTHPDPKIGTRVYSPFNVEFVGGNPTTAGSGSAGSVNPIEFILTAAGDPDGPTRGIGRPLPPFTVNVAPRATPARPMSVQDAFINIQKTIAANLPAKRTISLKGIAPQKTTIDLRAASRVIASQPKAPAGANVIAAPPPPSLLSAIAPYAPVAGGVLLMPVVGFLAPVVGVAATVAWLWKKRA